MARLRRRRGGLRRRREVHCDASIKAAPCRRHRLRRRDPYEDAACNTLKLTFSKPAPYFHTVMALWVTYPAKEENITEGGENWWNSSKYQIGNGPFVLKSLEPFVQGYFTPNAELLGRQGQASTSSTRYITDTAVAFEAYKNNEFDIIDSGR